LYRLSEELAQSQLQARVHEIYLDPSVGALIIQLPLPAKYDRVGVLNEIGIDKDVDVLNGETSRILAPAAGSLERILKEIAFDVTDKDVVVVGSGLLIGRPIADWLMGRVKTLAIMNKGGYDPAIVRNADLVITGTGVPRLIKGDHLKKDAVVIDYGYGRDESDTLSGDVDFKSASRIAGHITPTPGGTGPIVVAMLFSNFYRLAG
jgi:methylenetetrahydrofolate dehydrogenase (NADP+) / methenyltetrahydrofolate cyclohydrolase